MYRIITLWALSLYNVVVCQLQLSKAGKNVEIWQINGMVGILQWTFVIPLARFALLTFCHICLIFIIMPVFISTPTCTCICFECYFCRILCKEVADISMYLLRARILSYPITGKLSLLCNIPPTCKFHQHFIYSMCVYRGIHRDTQTHSYTHVHIPISKWWFLLKIVFLYF